MAKQRFWEKKGTANDPKSRALSVKHGWGVVIAWACMGASGTVTNLVTTHHISCNTLQLHITHGLHFPSTIAPITQLCIIFFFVFFVVVAISSLYLTILTSSHTFLHCLLLEILSLYLEKCQNCQIVNLELQKSECFFHLEAETSFLWPASQTVLLNPLSDYELKKSIYIHL